MLFTCIMDVFVLKFSYIIPKEIAYMITLQKSPDKDFKILNLADVQMGNNEWQPCHKFRAILDATLDALIEKVKECK